VWPVDAAPAETVIVWPLRSIEAHPLWPVRNLFRRFSGKVDYMNIDIIKEEENPMLHRTDVRFEVTHEEATPSRLSVRDSLAAMLNKDAEEVVIHKLDTKFGMRTSVGYAKVYESPSHAQDVEQDYLLERNKIAVGDGEKAEEA